VNAPLLPSTEAEDIAFDRAYVKRHGLYGFVKLCFAIVAPNTPFVDGPHIRQICIHLEAASLGLLRHLIINVPPGSSKSLTTSVLWPAFVWGPMGQPHKKWLFTSFDSGLATRDADLSRQLIESEWFQKRWPLEWSRAGRLAITDFGTSKGGTRRSVGVGGKITGRHPDIIVVDDPIKAAKTQGNAGIKKTDLMAVQTWWGGTMASRGADPKKTVRVVIMQRLHDDDLTGFILNRAKNGGQEYQHLRLPMRYEPEEPCVTYLDNGMRLGGDWRTREGELLCADRWGDAQVDQLERDLGQEFSAQYQQRPARKGGQIFQKAWFRYWTADMLQGRGANPYTGEGFDNLICSWDFTFKDTLGSDYVCGQVWGKLGPDYFMLERVYQRMNFPNSLTAIETQLRRWPRIGAKVVEDKANGPAILASLERKVSGLVAWPNSKGKIANANSVSYLHRAGNVFYPPEFEHATGDDSHVECMAKFPLARHDDTVDAETQALAYFEENRNRLYEALKAGSK
jgi:predicted phage terminase large subunit-like protein